MPGGNLRNEMIVKQIKQKGILTKFLEQGIKILIIKECKKIINLKIDIISTSTQIIKGEIKKSTFPLRILIIKIFFLMNSS